MEDSAPEMKESQILGAPRDDDPPTAAAVSGPLISNFGALVATPPPAPAPSAPRAAPSNSLEHFQLKQALVRAKNAGLSMREVAQLVSAVYSGPR